MPIDSIKHPLVALANSKQVTNKTKFAGTCRELTICELSAAYYTEIKSAPRRDKSFFVERHHGYPSTEPGKVSSRDEEHLALAIYNNYSLPGCYLDLPDGNKLRLLDYQLPLKAVQSDQSLKALDLFGVTNSGQAVVVELKRANGKDTPLRALFEALTYTAVVQANIDRIRRQAKEKYKVDINPSNPLIIIMAPQKYWDQFRGHKSLQNWASEMMIKRKQIEQCIGISVQYVSIGDANFKHGHKKNKPALFEPIICRHAVN